MMSSGGYTNKGNDGVYSASPKNLADSRSKQIGPDDGFHSRPPRGEQSRRRKAAIVLVACVGIVVALFVARATGDRDEQLQDSTDCTVFDTAQTCDPGEPSE